jgi:hypothetical protein
MSQTNNGPMLSKSKFVQGLQCHKALYLQMHSPELADPVPASREALFQAGNEVGELAQELFPGGVLIPYNANSYDGQIALTKAEMDKGTEVLYEAAFSYDGVFVKVDILRLGPGGWELYEVKSSASVQPYHVPDIAVQYYVLTGAGVNVSSAYLAHINTEYVRNGEIEPGKLFALEDMTGKVQDMEDFVKTEIGKMKTMLKGDMPAMDIGAYCTNPFDCNFYGHCWQHVPKDSVFTLRDRGVDKFSLYRNGIIRLQDVPLDLLNARQRQQADFFLARKEFVDKEALNDFLDTIRYPVYFLDFETVRSTIPLYDGTSPFQQVPYQYSLHYLEHEGGDLGHHEFLAEPNIDPREEVAANLCGQIPDNACVLAYNAPFEIGILRQLGEDFPRYKQKLQRIIGNTIDLAAPFRSRHIYHWEMNGSYSQKTVLPLLVPDLSYKVLEIANGSMAMDAYFAMCASRDTLETTRIREKLLQYCALDTLGMVRILERLKAMAQGKRITDKNRTKSDDN